MSEEMHLVRFTRDRWFQPEPGVSVTYTRGTCRAFRVKEMFEAFLKFHRNYVEVVR